MRIKISQTFCKFSMSLWGWHDVLQFRGAPVTHWVSIHLNFFPWSLAEDILLAYPRLSTGESLPVMPDLPVSKVASEAGWGHESWEKIMRSTGIFSCMASTHWSWGQSCTGDRSLEVIKVTEGWGRKRIPQMLKKPGDCSKKERESKSACSSMVWKHGR